MQCKLRAIAALSIASAVLAPKLGGRAARGLLEGSLSSAFASLEFGRPGRKSCKGAAGRNGVDAGPVLAGRFRSLRPAGRTRSTSAQPPPRSCLAPGENGVSVAQQEAVGAMMFLETFYWQYNDLMAFIGDKHEVTEIKGAS